MIGPRMLTMFCAGLVGLSAWSARSLDGPQNRSDSGSKSVVTDEPDRSSELTSQSKQDRGSPLDDRDRGLSGRSSFTASGEGHRQGITKPNKASCLIGMEVRNQENEKLGDIKDLVLDLPSGRISYLVLSSGGFLGFGERLVAIPPTAIQVSADAEHLVINADKPKIMNAPTFAKTSWPDPKSADFETYWTSDREAMGGASAGVSVGADSGRGGRNDYGGDTGDPQRNHRVQSAFPSNRKTIAKAENHSFKGRITAINPEARTMTVEGEDGVRSFTFTDRPMLALKRNQNPQLSDFKVGYGVAVSYQEAGDEKYMAHAVTYADVSEIR